MTLADLLWLKFTILLIISKLPSTQQFRNDNIVFNYNNTYKYNVVYEVSVNKHTEYIMEFAGDLEVYDTPARVTIASDFANRTYPLFITARQQKGVFSWQLPMLVQTPSSLEQFTNISRTLCPHNNLFDEHQDNCDISTQNTPIVHLTSASPDDIKVTILVETVKDFYIQLDTLTNLTSTPSQPKYYFYPFKQEPHRTDLDLDAQAAKRKYICNKDLQDVEKRRLNVYFERSSASERDERSWFWKPKSVILMIESDDDICAVVSIQNFTCPVFDNERDILYDGFYLTMTRRGGITLTQDQFPLGFYIVFIVKSSDEACTLPVAATNASAIRLWGGDLATGEARVKNFSFTIVQTISYQEYMIAAGAALGFFLSFYLLFIAAAVAQRRASGRGRGRGGAGDAPEGDDLTAPVTPHDDASVSIARRRIVRAEPAMNVSVESTSRQHLIGDSHNTYTENASTDSESDFSSAEDNPSSAPDKDRHNRLCLASLAQKRASVLTRRSNMYLWNVLTVTVFYTLPVIQLVVTYQRMLNQSGNQDLCYFNFFCAHPLLFLSDFNHVYSNLGYILLGLLFLVQVWRRHSAHRMKTEQQKELGIPQHFGLLYAMGIALVSEGLLSAAYHVCPNSMNFQFDTSFMYVTGVLCMVKVYQSRHPDINARAHATFGVLALIIFIGLVGVLNADLYFWAGFTVLHLLTCSVMTFQIYYMGRFRLDAGVVYRAGVQLCRRPLSAVTPTHVARCVLLLTANLANWALAGYGVAQHSRDFGSHLLTVVMSNLFLYTLFYIAMKLLHKEYIRWYSWVFIALTYTTWFSSSYFFLDLSTNWALTPAQSRQSNRVCSLLQLYDSHDVWHFMSSSAMFFSFNMYLTIDDNLDGTPRDEIMVF